MGPLLLEEEILAQPFSLLVPPPQLQCPGLSSQVDCLHPVFGFGFVSRETQPNSQWHVHHDGRKRGRLGGGNNGRLQLGA